MPLQINDRGCNNKIYVSKDTAAQLSGAVEIHGDNNTVLICDGCRSTGNLSAILRNDSTLEIGSQCQMAHNFFYLTEKTEIHIGSQTAFNGICWIQLHEPSKVQIGSGCLFGGDTNIITSDMHTIFDVETGKRINPSADVVVEDNVWVGARAFIMKGCRIGGGSIVGLGSVVTRDVPGYSAVAGNPARVIRTGVTWRRDLIPVV